LNTSIGGNASLDYIILWIGTIRLQEAPPLTAAEQPDTAASSAIDL